MVTDASVSRTSSKMSIDNTRELLRVLNAPNRDGGGAAVGELWHQYALADAGSDSDADVDSDADEVEDEDAGSDTDSDDFDMLRNGVVVDAAIEKAVALPEYVLPAFR